MDLIGWAENFAVCTPVVEPKVDKLKRFKSVWSIPDWKKKGIDSRTYTYTDTEIHYLASAIWKSTTLSMPYTIANHTRDAYKVAPQQS